MPKVALVTDSTAYIPTELSQEYSIHTVPLQLIWGPQTLRDGVEIQPAEFYTRLQSSKDNPTTSQPSPAAFMELYQRLLDEGHEIVSVHVSSKLSGTLDSAIQAKAHFPGAPIELVDSLTTSMSLGFPVLEAAKAAKEGASLDECRALVERGCKQTGILFAVQTLEYLRRGGRIGGAQAFLGTVLNLKPILELREGRIEAVERVRTMNKAVDRLLDLFQERVGDRKNIHIACVYSSSPEEARLLLERARQRFDPASISELLIAPISPVVGVHTGPGCMGLTYMAGI